MTGPFLLICHPSYVHCIYVSLCSIINFVLFSLPSAFARVYWDVELILKTEKKNLITTINPPLKNLGVRAIWDRPWVLKTLSQHFRDSEIIAKPQHGTSPQVLTISWSTINAHYGNLLISLSGSRQPKDTTTPTSNRPFTSSGGQLCSGRWFSWANLFTGTSPAKVTTSRVSTIPSLVLLQHKRKG